MKIGQAYLRDALEKLLHRHAAQQRTYHEAKAQRLTRVHHRLDKLSERLFALAVLSVSTYLLLIMLSFAGVVSGEIVNKLSKSFTFLGVILPALGGAFAGIRYFGDFERFAAISEVTAEKLAEVEQRIGILLNVGDGELRYSQVADLAHAIDDIVVTEIENWQFGVRWQADRGSGLATAPTSPKSQFRQALPFRAPLFQRRGGRTLLNNFDLIKAELG